MQFWDDMNPIIRRSVLVGVLLLGALLAVRYYASTPVGAVADHRGISR